MIKSTYALDVETVRSLEALARRWKVSKSEALRRAIHAMSGATEAPQAQALAALDQLQRTVALTGAQAARWAGRTLAERRASSARRLRPRP